jgi:hypothetical protein
MIPSSWCFAEERNDDGDADGATQLFCDFCLDDYVPEDHLHRRIGRFLDLEKVRTELKPLYSSIGRPSINPELMMRMLGFDGRIPDHHRQQYVKRAGRQFAETSGKTGTATGCASIAKLRRDVVSDDLQADGFRNAAAAGVLHVRRCAVQYAAELHGVSANAAARKHIQRCTGAEAWDRGLLSPWSSPYLRP